jgi:hypothetical protein
MLIFLLFDVLVSIVKYFPENPFGVLGDEARSPRRAAICIASTRALPR